MLFGSFECPGAAIIVSQSQSVVGPWPYAEVTFTGDSTGAAVLYLRGVFATLEFISFKADSGQSANYGCDVYDDMNIHLLTASNLPSTASTPNGKQCSIQRPLSGDLRLVFSALTTGPSSTLTVRVHLSDTSRAWSGISQDGGLGPLAGA